MAAEGKLGESKGGLSIGLLPASLANLTKQDKASEGERSPSDVSSSLYSLTSTTSCINNALRQEPIAEPGHDGTNSKLYGNAREELKTSFKGMTLNNESCVCHITGYNPYATGSMVGVDGKCIGPKPSVSVGGPTALSKSVHSNSIKRSGTVDANVQLNSNSFLSTPSSNFFKCSLQSQHVKPQNKVPQLGSDFRSAMLCKGSYSAKSLSSPSNQVGGFSPNGPSVHRPSVQTGVCLDGYKIGEKFNSSCNYEAQKESARGPRSRRVHTLLNSSFENEQLGPGVGRDRYNRSDFQTAYNNAKFFVIKSYSEDDIHKSIKYDVWSSTPNGNRKLNAAFHDTMARYNDKGSKCPIFLFFSVNGSGQFLGLAEMIGPVDFEKDMDFWQQDKWSGFFPVTWQIIKDIPNNRLRHIILENNDNKPVTYTRDTQEVGLKQGLEMLSIFKSYTPITSMLDDYKFYDDLEKLFQLRKSFKQEYPEYDSCYRTEIRERSFQAGPRKAEQVAATRGARNMSEESFTSLAALARSLSLNRNNMRSI